MHASKTFLTFFFGFRYLFKWRAVKLRSVTSHHQVPSQHRPWPTWWPNEVSPTEMKGEAESHGMGTLPLGNGRLLATHRYRTWKMAEMATQIWNSSTPTMGSFRGSKLAVVVSRDGINHTCSSNYLAHLNRIGMPIQLAQVTKHPRSAFNLEKCLVKINGFKALGYIEAKPTTKMWIIKSHRWS